MQHVSERLMALFSVLWMDKPSPPFTGATDITLVNKYV